jgi:hypothetical protein
MIFCRGKISFIPEQIPFYPGKISFIPEQIPFSRGETAFKSAFQFNCATILPGSESIGFVYSTLPLFPHDTIEKNGKDIR